MKKYAPSFRVVLYTVLFCFPLMAYLNFLLGVPSWVCIIIFCLLLLPPISFYIRMILVLVYMYISIAIHIYTIVFAFLHIWWKGVLTAVLPGISQVYWFIVDGQAKGFGSSLFCKILLWYVFGLIITYVYLPMLCSGAIFGDKKKDNKTYIEEPREQREDSK